MVSDAVTMPVGMATDSEKSVTFEVFPAREIVLLKVPPIFSVPPGPKSNIQRARFFSLRAVSPFHRYVVLETVMRQKG